jgi:chromosome segregation ATPase
MTNDELERAIDILLKNQANFDVRIEKTNEQLARTDEKVRQLTEQVSAIAGTQNHFIQVVTRFIETQGQTNESLRAAQAQTNESLRAVQAQTNESLRAAQARTDEALARLAEAQAQTDEALKQTNEALKRLAEAQAHSDRRLDALIDIVQGGRNGQ